MKKLVLTALATLSLGVAAMAQMIDPNSLPKIPHRGEVANPFNHKSLGKGGNFISDWYSIADMVGKSNIASSLTPYVGFNTHDSLNKFVFSDGKVSWGYYTGYGQILDPKDDLIQLGDKPENQLSPFNSYQVDSIGFLYLYVRNVDSIPDGMGGKKNVVDTVFLHYFAGAQINKASATTAKKWANITSWDYNRRLPANYVAEQVVLLPSGANGELDTTRANNNNGFENSFSVKYAQFAAPAGMSITAASDGSTVNNLTGFSVIFKSGIPAVVGTDTAIALYMMDPATLPAGTRRTNYFGYRYLSNDAGTVGWDNPKFYNTSLFGSKTISYKDLGTGYHKGFIPGINFGAGNEAFLQTYFHLTVTGSIGAGVSENDQVAISQVYPNPARQTVRTTFETKSNADVKIELFDLLGNNVKTVNYGKVTAGTYNSNIDLSGLNTGIYLIQVTAGTSTTTQKLVIAE